METLTIKELIDSLNQFPLNTKVFISSDSEGNSYNTLNKKWLFQETEDRKSIIILPFAEGITYEEIDSKHELAYQKAEAQWKKQQQENHFKKLNTK